jgi:hypothetical protein
MGLPCRTCSDTLVCASSKEAGGYLPSEMYVSAIFFSFSFFPLKVLYVIVFLGSSDAIFRPRYVN